MKICVAGYYFHKPFMNAMEESKYDSFIVAHRDFIGITGGPSTLEKSGILYTCIPNVGLEFGCYDWYLKNKWDGGDILFLHDDNEITEQTLDAISNIGRDQVFLFSSKEEAAANGYAHGRAVFCSERFLKRLKEDGGFWYDEGNDGRISATTATEPDYHNAGIKVFRSYLETVKDMTVNRYAVIPGLKTGYRGRV